MNLAILKTELTTDPLGRGYANMDDDAAAKSLSFVIDRDVNRDTLDGGLLVASIVRSEFASLSAGDKQYVQLIAMAGSLPLTATVKAELGGIFPAGSTTRANLVALLKRKGSRADDLGLGTVTASDIADAKRS